MNYGDHTAERRVVEALHAGHIRRAQQRRRGPERETRLHGATWTAILERHHHSELAPAR